MRMQVRRDKNRMAFEMTPHASVSVINSFRVCVVVIRGSLINVNEYDNSIT